MTPSEQNSSVAGASAPEWQPAAATAPPAAGAGPGLTGPLVVWALWIAVAAATWATNARTPVGRLYGVSGSGVRAGAGRVLVLFGWPIALVAIPLLASAVERLLASPPTVKARRTIVTLTVLAVVLCATIGLPGVVDARHLDAKPVNAAAAVGVAIALGLTVWALVATGRGRSPSLRRADLYWLLPFCVLLFAGLPWLLANLGFYVGDVPGLRAVFMSKQLASEPGYPHLAAVHLGNHDGFDGLLLALSAVVLMRSLGQMHRLRTAMSAYLALLLVYGLAVATSDWWLEQLVKRGTLTETIPSPMRPSLSLTWAAILAAAALVYLLEVRLLDRATRPVSGSRSDSLSAAP